MHHSEQIWNVNLLIGLLVISILYLLGIRFLEKRSMKTVVKNDQIASFIVACSLIFLSFGSPMAMHSHHYLSIHMLQMSMLCFIIPPLLIYSLPLDYLKKRLQLFKFPLVGIISFASIFYFYHIPQVFDWMMSSQFVHILFHLLLFSAAIIMWLPLTPKLINEVLGDKRKRYLNYKMWLIMPPCMFLLVMNIEVYGIFQAHSHGKIFSNMMDQRLSGIIMIILHQLSIFVYSRPYKRKNVNERALSQVNTTA
ncbi:cytochrome c oxidase assembly protein [Virgibacillus sediminis]|uniref:Cytochrome c oxidase assembly protein n=1 Tax=Virgibacillus sediminis TaxID=202260 RepID=A0ABV7A3T3_9BACI